MAVANINLFSEIDKRCKTCFLKTYQLLFEKFNVNLAHRQQFTSIYQETILQSQHLSSPEIQRELNKAFCRIISVKDPFYEEKAQSNRIALELYKEWKPKVLSSIDPFDLALRLSIAGNIMDYGANNKFDIHETIKTVLTAPLAIDHSTILKNKIRKANKILVLGDNAGEIVFDKLFIETSMHHEVFYAVKGAPVLNDVTTTDAKEIEMHLIADVISNGFDAPSTVLNKCTKEFLDVYFSSDLIISKGQGNYEGLMGTNDTRIFFLLVAKCDVIAEKLKVNIGDFIIYHNT